MSYIADPILTPYACPSLPISLFPFLLKSVTPTAFFTLFLLKSKQDTEKKILHNVVRPGDKYFRSGDILLMDQFGWIYFKDRAGDTFRSFSIHPLYSLLWSKS